MHRSNSCSQDAIDVDVWDGSTWIHVYQGSYESYTWVEKTFGERRISKARVRFHNGWWYQFTQFFYEFDFHPVGAVYSGYDKTTRTALWITQKWELWVLIDTDAHTWYVKWKQTGSWPYSPLMYCEYLSYIKAWDDKGFSWNWGPPVYPAHGFSGELTLSYENFYTWTHTEICWCYATTPFTYDYVKCRVDIYVAS